MIESTYRLIYRGNGTLKWPCIRYKTMLRHQVPTTPHACHDLHSSHLPLRRYFSPALRYASVGTIAVALCLSVCLSVSVTSRCSIKRNERINLFFLARRILSTSRTLCFKEIEISTKIRVLPLELFPKISSRRIVRRTCFQLSSRMFMPLTA